jgi:hypothetical protein
MLSTAELNALSQIFGACCKTHCLPLDWDSFNFKLKVTRSRPKLVLSRILLAWKLLYTPPLVLRLRPDLTWNVCERRIEQQIFHSVLAIALICIGTEWVSFTFFSEEVCLLFNRLIQFNRQQGKRRMDNVIDG